MQRAYKWKNAYVIFNDGTREDLTPERYVNFVNDDPKTNFVLFRYIEIMKHAAECIRVVGHIDGELLHKRIWPS